ncbi:MAG: multi-sensor signal transduction histidine kinase [Acidobacteria bacterium]|nr:multi-sensor signal transduction histidine kinase [Acidobacteriota bacterium]
MKVRTRVTASFVAIVVLMVVVDIIAVVPYRLILSSSEGRAAVDQAALAVLRVNVDVYAFTGPLAAATSSADVRRLKGEAAVLRGAFGGDVDRAERLIVSSTHLAGDATIRGALDAIKAGLPFQLDRIVALAAAGDWPAARLRLAYDVPPLVDISSVLVDRLESAVAHEREAADARAQGARQLFVVVVIATLAALLMAVGLAWSTTRAITKPLAVLEAGAHALARGDFQHRITLTGSHELAGLGSAFNYAVDRIGELFAERERAEEQLRRSQADLAHVTKITTVSELAASLAHEIRQPMTAAMTDVKTSLRWLSRDEPDTAEARAAATRAVQDVTRATEIISRIRSLFKQDDQQRQLLDVNDVIDEMVPLLRGEAHRYGVSIRADLDRGVPPIMADRVQVQQVLMNLMLNGIEAMKETRGHLIVMSRASQQDVLISVSDTGVGLAPEHGDQMFNAFFTTKAQGTGMGLSISRSIVHSHGGRLWADANAGPGATFSFTLPIADGR